MDDPRIGRVVAGRYKLSAQLAEGGMGIVYRGERVGIGRPVVVKFLHAMLSEKAGIVDRFEREARATALLNHPNCVALVDFGLDDGAPFLVMEYAEGRTLADVLDRGPIAPARAVRIINQVLSGLAHAHARGILHRDLKPANVMIVDLPGFEDVVKILDFGLAKMVGPVIGGSGNKDVTVEGIAIGTPGYMSPEQAAGIPSDRRADIYCTGALLYHMVTGQKAFDGEDLHSVLRRHREETPIAPAAVVPSVRISVQLEDVILRSMKREPGDRYQAADDMIVALKDTPEARSENVPKRPSSRPPENDTRAELPRSRAKKTSAHPFRWLFLGGLVGATSAAGGILYVQRPTPDLEPPAVASVPPPPPAKIWELPPKIVEAPTIVEPSPSPSPSGEAVVEALKPSPLEDDGSSEDDHSLPPEAAAAPHKDMPQVRTLADARNLLKKGDADGALAALLRLRRGKPPPARASEIAQLIGHLYFDRHWWTDALKEYRFAIALDGKARKDALLVSNVVRTLGDNSTFPRGKKLLVSYVGKGAVGPLKKAAHSGGSPLLRKNAALVLAQIKPAHAKNR